MKDDPIKRLNLFYHAMQKYTTSIVYSLSQFPNCGNI